MKRPTIAWTAVALLAACTENTNGPLDPLSYSSSSRPELVIVQSSGDAGPGSFRDAIERANADPAIQIVQFAPGISPIVLASTITFLGPQPLTILGAGVVIDGSELAGAAGAFIASGGGDLTIKSMTVQEAPGTGITVAVPATEAGDVRVTLHRVSALRNGGHGVLINDQTGYLTDPASTSEAGSDAGVMIDVRASRFERNGLGGQDRGGLRVNEAGPGHLTAWIDGTLVLENGGDGIELIERAAGDANFELSNTQLVANGGFSGANYEDGLEVAEWGDGDIIARMKKVSATGNLEEGFDLNENGPGDLRVTASQIVASGNREEGIDLEEDDYAIGGGNLIATLSWITANGNLSGDGGLRIHEKGEGNLATQIANTTVSGNKGAGVFVREDAEGHLDAVIQGTTADGNTEPATGEEEWEEADEEVVEEEQVVEEEEVEEEPCGIVLVENGAGNLTAAVWRVVATNNTDFGLSVKQNDAGVGTLTVVRLAATGNTVGPISANAGVTVTVR